MARLLPVDRLSRSSNPQDSLSIQSTDNSSTLPSHSTGGFGRRDDHRLLTRSALSEVPVLHRRVSCTCRLAAYRPGIRGDKATNAVETPSSLAHCVGCPSASLSRPTRSTTSLWGHDPGTPSIPPAQPAPNSRRRKTLCWTAGSHENHLPRLVDPRRHFSPSPCRACPFANDERASTSSLLSYGPPRYG